MIQGLIGKKIEMTQIFDEEGHVVPVTRIQAGPCVIVKKDALANGSRLQLGFVEAKRVKNVNKAMKGHFEKANVPPTRILRELYAEADSINVGDTVKADIFEVNEMVTVVGTTKGKGFQGVIRRHGYHGGRSTHGSMFHRAIGSAGANTYPGRVIKGKGMPGRMGGKKRSISGLKVISVDAETNIILVKGAVPGFKGNYVVLLKKSFKRR